MLNTNLSIVILAGGKGKRMHSALPKVLHPLAGQPMIKHIIETVKEFSVRCIYLIYGYAGNELKNCLKNEELKWIFQAEQFGTGHAIQKVIPFLNDNEDVLILPGDVPLISKETLIRLCEFKPHGGISLLTSIVENPIGYGRIVRKNNLITNIVEDKDVTIEQKKIYEINTGILVVNSSDLKRWSRLLNNNNYQKEYYLTDIINFAYKEARLIKAIHPKDNVEACGVNDHLQLARLERAYQKIKVEKLLLSGVTLFDPTRFDLRGSLECSEDVKIDINTIIEGKVKLGKKVSIGIGCVIKDSIIGDNCKINSYSVIDSAVVGSNCIIGPFAHLRAGTEIEEIVHVGNFVETKKANIGKGSKIGHLSYIGDASLGESVNVGAGTITCNFDGANKFKTIIGNNVFIGSDTQLIAPLNIIDGATIAAGTTLIKDVTNAALVYDKKYQKYKLNWKRPKKK